MNIGKECSPTLHSSPLCGRLKKRYVIRKPNVQILSSGRANGISLDESNKWERIVRKILNSQLSPDMRSGVLLGTVSFFVRETFDSDRGPV